MSGTLDQVDWNAELVRGDLGNAVQQLKRSQADGLFVGGVKLPLALADLGLIDEYEFVVQPILAGHGPTLFAGSTDATSGAWAKHARVPLHPAEQPLARDAFSTNSRPALRAAATY